MTWTKTPFRVVTGAVLFLGAAGLGLVNCGLPDPSELQPSDAGSETSSQSPTPSVDRSTVSRSIGAAGGTLEHPTGAKLLVPAGALTEAKEVSITGIDAPAKEDLGYAALGQGFRMEPDGLVFAKPVTLVLPFDADLVPSGGNVDQIQIHTAANGTNLFSSLPTKADLATGRVTAESMHFSVFVPAANPNPVFVTTKPTLPRAVVGESYTTTLAATGGTPPYRWSIAQGGAGLPGGLSLAQDGTIAGTPSAIGAFGFNVLVEDDGANRVQRALSITVEPVTNPAPTLAAIAPSTVAQGSADTVLTLTGTGFVPSSKAAMGSVALETTYVSATSLTALVPAAQLATSGSFPITVSTAPPGGGTSAPLTFEITSVAQNPLPTVTSIDPASAPAGSPDTQITITGTGFIAGSKALIGSFELATSFTSATSLEAILPASRLSDAGTVRISVHNPAPGGGTSDTVAFTVTATPTGDAHLRVANLVPDFGSAVDFCFGPMGGALTGPYMAGVGAAGGLAYPSASEYVKVSSGQRYTVRAVAAGAADCSTAIAGLADFTTSKSIGTGEHATVAILGETAGGSPDPAQLREYFDSATPAANQHMRLRVVNASPGTGALVFGEGAGDLYTEHLTNLAFGAVPSAGNVVGGASGVDALGYLDSPRWAHSWTARSASTGEDIARLMPDTWTLVSAFVVGKAGSATAPPGVLACRDAFGPSNHLSNCLSRLLSWSPVIDVRFVALGGSADAFDVCMSQGGDFPDVPLLRAKGQTGGMTMPSQTRTFKVVSSENLEIAFVPAGPTSTCAATPVAAPYQLSLMSPTTFELVQTDFSATPKYEVFYNYTAGQLTANQANLRLRNTIPFGFSIWVKGSGTAWWSDYRYNRVGMGYDVHPTAGTYTVTVHEATANSAAAWTSGAHAIADADVATYYYHAKSAATKALARCDDASTALVAPCTSP